MDILFPEPRLKVHSRQNPMRPNEGDWRLEVLTKSHHRVASRGYGVVRLGGFHAGVCQKTLFILELTTSLRDLVQTHMRVVAINQATSVVS